MKYLTIAAAAVLAARATVLGADTNILPEYHNREVTSLVEDSESVRLALGAAWDDALSCRAMSGYLRAWSKDDSRDAAEVAVRRGARMYERVKCVDDGINSVRLLRDARDAKFGPQLLADLKFWRNELALAAKEVSLYAMEASALKDRLEKELRKHAGARGISSRNVPAAPWDNPQREAWRRAGPATGVRLPLDPFPGSFPEWWDRNLSLRPGYLVAKLRSAGDVFFTDDNPIGAWGHNCSAPGKYDWAKFDRTLRVVHDNGGKLLLELPTLLQHRTDEQIAEMREKALQWGWYLMWPGGYAPALPKDLCQDRRASLVAREDDGTLRPHGGVQLFDPATAAAYGQYLRDLASHLKSQDLYDAVAAVHLEMGEGTELPESVDYSDLARDRWQEFLEGRYRDIGSLNRAAATQYRSFTEVPIPFRAVPPRVAADWQEFAGKLGKNKPDGNAWLNFLLAKYKPANPASTDPPFVREQTLRILREKLGDDYQDGYQSRLPHDYPPVIKIDYLHFRRQWVREYMAVKRRLVEAAFSDKLIIAEMWQFGDHDGVQGKGERKWGGFAADDYAQWTGTGPDNAARPFQLRSVGPVGFGTRPSDSLESLFRDYLWLNFRDPGNLTRYFYHWVAHGYMDYQLGWHSVTNHWLTNRLMYRLGPTVASTLPQPQRIGMLLPRATLDLFDGASYFPYMGWDWALHAAKLPYSRIDEQAVRDGKLAELGLQVLVLPEVRAMDDKVAAEVDKWVASGGLLVASNVPGRVDEYGRPRPASPLARVLGVRSDGTVSEPVEGTPLTITVPHGHYSGRWAQSTSRRPEFEALAPADPKAKVLARYFGGKPAIVLNEYGKGRAVTLGYPSGAETVACEQTSIGFQRTYVWFVREPQLVARTAWLRKFLVNDMGFRPDFEVEYAEVGRFKGNEAIAPDLHTPKGLSQDPASPWFARTVGDPRPGHEIEVARESPDLAVRFFPRCRAGVATKYVGISTREVHYLGPRATVNVILMKHAYRCRINNPKIEAIWDVGRDVPVGFERDGRGASFTVELPSGHVMMLAVSESPALELFGPAPFPGRDKEQVAARCRELAGGSTPPAVTVLTPAFELRDWAKELAAPLPTPAGSKQPGPKESVVISYGQPANRAAADKLASGLKTRFGVDASVVEQVLQVPANPDTPLAGFEKPMVLIGDEWTNNDLAMHGAYWGLAYSAHLPFTATYPWPGVGRAVVSLSRPYALINEEGRHPFAWAKGYALRPVDRRFSLVRRKLHIAANGQDADRAVDSVLAALGSQ
jgi:hypothetical protein